MAQFLLVEANKTMEQSISVIGWTFEQSERFSELGELGELFESLNVDIDGDGIMELLISDLFRGVFDPKNLDAKPSRYARTSHEQTRTMAVPSWTFMNSVLLRAGDCRGKLNHKYGSSHDLVALLYAVKALPFDTPDELHPSFIDDAVTKLAALPIDQFSEMARDILDCVMVERTVLRRWFEDQGMLSPVGNPDADSSTTYADAANCNILRTSEQHLLEVECARPGRPSSDFWPRVQELVMELHKANPDAYNNAMASEIHERLAAEFPGEQILALTTIQGNMKALRENARAILGE